MHFSPSACFPYTSECERLAPLSEQKAPDKYSRFSGYNAYFSLSENRNPYRLSLGFLDNCSDTVIAPAGKISFIYHMKVEGSLKQLAMKTPAALPKKYDMHGFDLKAPVQYRQYPAVHQA